MNLSLFIFCLITVFSISGNSASRFNEKIDFKDNQYSHHFEKTLIFGHSISSNLLDKIPIIRFQYGESPGDVLAKQYAQKQPLANISEGSGTMETGLYKIYRLLNNIDASEPKWYQRPIESEHLSSKKLNHLFNQATAMVGIDAFYMSVVFNECRDYAQGALENTLHRLVQKAFHNQKILILGNVPKEDWSKVKLLSRMIVQNKNESCRKRINSALKKACFPQLGCYIVDLEKIVSDLNTDGHLTLNDGRKILQKGKFLFREYNEVRPDGINLSPLGTEYVVEQILESMKVKPAWTPNSLIHP